MSDKPALPASQEPRPDRNWILAYIMGIIVGFGIGGAVVSLIERAK